MNAPLSHRDLAAGTGSLTLFAVFHLNLAFSSIEEESRAEVIRRCYWPLLRLAQESGPIGVEASGYTLEEIVRLDPEWCGRLRALIACGRIEFVGSGFAQVIGPLVPARVTDANLSHGNKVYQSILGIRPDVALVNEQAYSAGLVGLYLDAGYRAILMDWDNPGAHHPEWSAETRYLPQRAAGSDGRDIALLWTSTVAFQKLQRLAHGDISLDSYRDFIRTKRSATPRTLCMYANDAEIFDFRPGRYRTEEGLSDCSEWTRLNSAFRWLHGEAACRLVAPSAALELAQSPGGGQPLTVESATCPVPVKKQRKYALSRWAVTGRDDLAINAACERIYRGLSHSNADDASWKELCYLWSSDFRTHITDARWRAYCERLRAMEKRFANSRFASHPVLATRCIGEDRPGQNGRAPKRHLEIRTPSLSVRLDRRRGLAIDSLHFAGHEHPVVGGLPHGHFDDIALQADWYTGDCVFEAPGEPKITDLEWCEPIVTCAQNGDVAVRTFIETPKGAIEKRLLFYAHNPRVDFDFVLHWREFGRGSLRVGHITLLPRAFDWQRLTLTTHNGGKEFETFRLKGAEIDHGAPVSFLVSSSFGIGMTEGWAELGDRVTRVRIEVDRTVAPLLGLLTHRKTGGSLFCQLALSGLELDETRKPCTYENAPRRLRFSICAAPPSVDC